MGHAWALTAQDGPHVGPMNLAIWGVCPIQYSHGFCAFRCFPDILLTILVELYDTFTDVRHCCFTAAMSVIWLCWWKDFLAIPFCLLYVMHSSGPFYQHGLTLILVMICKTSIVKYNWKLLIHSHNSTVPPTSFIQHFIGHAVIFLRWD